MQIYTLPLSELGEPLPAGKGQFIKLPNPADEPYILRLVIFSASDIINQGILHCNVPPPGEQFVRSKFYEYPINASFHRETHLDILISHSGAYSFFFTYLPVKDPYFSDPASDDVPKLEVEVSELSVSDSIPSQPFVISSNSLQTPSTSPLARSPYASSTNLPSLAKDDSQLDNGDSQDSESISPSEYMEEVDFQANKDRSCTSKFYFIVSAGLFLDGKPLSLNALNIESVISKWMGPFNSWKEKFTYIKGKGYNMVHFTPLNTRGSSNSPYSIYDQLSFDKELFANGEEDISSMVSYMEHDLHLLSLTDVVYNHTAHNSEWLRHHPESGYSTKTAPHLKPALELDNALLEFSADLNALGFPTCLNSLEDLSQIMNGIKDQVVADLKLWEYYTVDVATLIEQIVTLWKRDGPEITPIEVPSSSKANLKATASFVSSHAGVNLDTFGEGRYNRSVNVQAFVQILASLLSSAEFKNADKVRDMSISILNEINLAFYQDYDSDLGIILTQLYNRIKYTRLDSHGPRLGKITTANPLIETYFTRVKTHPNGEIVALVNNGWIWNGNPLIDFASSKSRAYLRREVIIWGDCVKLRYGNHPSDSPYLWERMTKYTQLMAKYFHGFRIDNAHSTPLHVGEYMLDMARLVRPDLYVVAELFTGSEEMDKIFVERLGLTSLIREAMQAWSVEELSRLVHRHGGRPIGSFSKQPIVTFEKFHEISDPNINSHLVQASNIHALFMDCTHDNETPAQKRTVEDTLPNAALVAMCACAVGSVMGYDECYPHLLEIVTEHRQYTFGGGISKIKKTLYDVHSEMGQVNSEEMHVHHEGQYITVHRVNPKTGEGWFLIARTKFSNEGHQQLNDVVLRGTVAESVVSCHLKKTGDYKSDDKLLNGIPTEIVNLEPPSISYDEASKTTTIKLNNPFPQGSIALIKTSINTIDDDLDSFVRSGADEAVSKLDFLDLNVVMYRCEGEERDYSSGTDGVYNIPNYGSLVYAGLVGWMGPLQEMVNDNNLAHTICEHLRDGQWALDYTVNRLQKYLKDFPRIKPFVEWLETRFDAIRPLPSFMIPRYFALIIVNAYLACRKRAISLMSPEIQHGTIFLQRLALTSIQMVGKLKSTSLLPFETIGCMAAGLPHFSHDYMRCWGRDVFLSLRGLLLSTGRYAEARDHILGFAATLKHGLIPNLLDAGRNPRYNARDATWFFAQIIQEYTKKVPDGFKILDDKVKRRFPLNDEYVPVDDPRAFQQETSIRDILYEILSRHAQSITFREANAGPNLDSQMKDEGFNQHIYVDWDNGLVFGGNKWNCGTWMDKMGESATAGSQGYPGTPRDGAAIEIIGLLKSTLRFVIELNGQGHFPYDSVTNQFGDKVTLKAWNDKIQANFEKCFFIPESPDDDTKYHVDPHIINRRGIYKDLYKSSSTYEDYQLRPNFAIAMVVAPELFDNKNAITAISIADRAIRGPVGMATLDPSDLNYRPYYRNSEDSTDFATSKGRNYHQGPEWLWCTGFFLRAFLYFDMLRKKENGGDELETFQQLSRRMIGHRQWIRTSHWAGLTELTNKDGEFCADSSPTQAWSSATLIDLFEDSRNYSNSEDL